MQYQIFVQSQSEENFVASMEKLAVIRQESNLSTDDLTIDG
ncbi:hypothetical protein RI030_14705 [Aphanizomenon flos-aquae NRERC-008]|nr:MULTISPECIES: hypothetical protein [Aphanizomenon]MDS9398815.1 hypothetical protein [Aphanizomenon flos-aquae NRERC-008]MDS9398822.1 hypothetical protein [Aphanizomenon flos-aquae NRERC-008]